jgi:hypothetical protein
MPNRRLSPDSSTALPDHSILSVDLKALTDVAAALRQEVAGNLQRHITQLNSAYGMGVSFGYASHSDNMKEARKVYHDCLVRATSLLSSCVAAGEALATAVDVIAQRYATTDAMAKARADEVDLALSEALKNTPVPDLALPVEKFSGRPGSFE